MNNLCSELVVNYMSTDLIIAYPTEAMSEVAKKMEHHHIHHLPVIDKDQKLQGIITTNDVQLLKNWASRLHHPSVVESNQQIFSSQMAYDCMHRDLVSVSPEDTLGKCAEYFMDNIFHALPVVKDGILVGMITTFDLIKAAYVPTLCKTI